MSRRFHQDQPFETPRRRRTHSYSPPLRTREPEDDPSYPKFQELEDDLGHSRTHSRHISASLSQEHLSPGITAKKVGHHKSTSTGDVFGHYLSPSHGFAPRQATHSTESFESFRPDSQELEGLRSSFKNCNDAMTEIVLNCRSKSRLEKSTGIESPSTLTFEKIGREMEDAIFRLKMWSVEVQLNRIQGFDPAKDANSVDQTYQTLNRLEENVCILQKLSKTASAAGLAAHDPDEAEVGSESDDEDSDSGRHSFIPFRFM
jgi:hypothetical protein